jgi:DNA polymerase III delta subunit
LKTGDPCVSFAKAPEDLILIYLLIGDDLPAKDARIAGIKLKFFKDFPQAEGFDFDNLDAGRLETDALKKAFLALPALAAHRLIVLRQIQKLKSADVRVLLDYCLKPQKYCDLVLESGDIELKGDLKDLSVSMRAEVFALSRPPDVFDMTRLITARRAAEALKMLDIFFRSNVRPLQIMGALVWYWRKEGRACGKERFEKGLKALEEADLNIKRSRIDPQYAVEKLVVELGLLWRR